MMAKAPARREATVRAIAAKARIRYQRMASGPRLPLILAAAALEGLPTLDAPVGFTLADGPLPVVPSVGLKVGVRIPPVEGVVSVEAGTVSDEVPGVVDPVPVVDPFDCRVAVACPSVIITPDLPSTGTVWVSLI